jgi:hypothetical protein
MAFAKNIGGNKSLIYMGEGVDINSFVPRLITNN